MSNFNLSSREKIFLPILLVLTLVILICGWKLFWFLTDDAFIDFRYVSNSIFGHGYVWNSPPFRPVEGYTSFLWILIEEFIWRIFNIKPPNVVNYLSLFFSFGTLIITSVIVLRMKLNDRIKKIRLLWLFLVLLGILSNTTFLAWTSSGLETALFNFLCLLWVYLISFCSLNEINSLFLVNLSAGFLYLTRPEGLVYVLASLFLNLLVVLSKKKDGWKYLLPLLPLLIVPLHLFWRHYYYGEWLPNTYFAKYVRPWPEAGFRYLLTFVIEYSMWAWLMLIIIVFLLRIKSWLKNWSKFFQINFIKYLVIIGVLVLNFAYYTFIIGGDYFEFRIYSNLIPLIFISTLWIINKLGAKSIVKSIAVFSLLIFLTWPVSWTHYITHEFLGEYQLWRKEVLPIAHYFPHPINQYVKLHDQLMEWMAGLSANRMICIRHKTHKEFLKMWTAQFVPREDFEKMVISDDNPNPVHADFAVGVPGWIMPQVAIIDRHGLNDYVIARVKIDLPNEKRRLAHDHTPPPGYEECFRPNVGRNPSDVGKRSPPLTDEDIIKCENINWLKIN